ncbi:DOPA-like domain-containing protein [Xylariaceae sp. FL1019]|nr:DOPA-like domain-containing protein [Xylariaceae sp. FL1019]
MSKHFTFGGVTYPSPLEGYEDLPALGEERTEDGKSLVNPKGDKLSSAYDQFTDPVERGRRGGFDLHIYYLPNDKAQTEYARALWERIRREFPELRIYRFWDKPVGPHAVPMFEVNVFTPAQFGALVSWLVVWRGPLSVLIHPNTVEKHLKEGEKEALNHSTRATWMGERLPVNVDLLRAIDST